MALLKLQYTKWKIEKETTTLLSDFSELVRIIGEVVMTVFLWEIIIVVECRPTVDKTIRRLPSV